MGGRQVGKSEPISSSDAALKRKLLEAVLGDNSRGIWQHPGGCLC